jgi:hypothetical protein
MALPEDEKLTDGLFAIQWKITSAERPPLKLIWMSFR